MEKTLRKIIVEEVTYQWRFIHGYRRDEANTYRRYDCFLAYQGRNYNCPLQIIFCNWEDLIINEELLQLSIPDHWINLHRPKWAAVLIKEGLKRGWQSEHPYKKLSIDNGIQLLMEIGEIADKS
jgi:hypothetical protein